MARGHPPSKSASTVACFRLAEKGQHASWSRGHLGYRWVAQTCRGCQGAQNRRGLIQEESEEPYSRAVQDDP